MQYGVRFSLDWLIDFTFMLISTRGGVFKIYNIHILNNFKGGPPLSKSALDACNEPLFKRNKNAAWIKIYYNCVFLSSVSIHLGSTQIYRFEMQIQNECTIILY